MPYLLRLAGKYVAAIVYLLAPLLNNAAYAQAWTSFLADNPRFYQQAHSYLLSYWNAYYRQQQPDFQRYIGGQVAARLRQLKFAPSP